MEYDKLPPELAAPPPEPGNRPELELAAPPPEFGADGRGAPAPAKKRRLRQFLAVPALLLVGFLCFHPVKAAPAPEGPSPVESGELPPQTPPATEPGSESTESTPALPGEPLLSGSMESVSAAQVEAVFRLIPAPEDAHIYQLRVLRMGQEVLDGEEIMGLSLVDDPGSYAVSEDPEGGYSFRYEGGTALDSIPQGTRLRLYAVLVDDSDGKEYTVTTNALDAIKQINGPTRYPLGEGVIVITVYNDTLNFDVPSAVEVEDDYRSFLAVESMEEADFTGYSLPEPINPGGFTFAGWVIHVNNPMDLSSESGDTNVFMEYNGDPPVEALITEDSFVFRVGDVLTPEDVELVPPTVTEEGASVRFVNVHAVWIREDSDPDFYLDDGMGHVTGYSQDSPMYSEGFLYLCAYPVPERPGYVFDGWYDAAGNRVDLLVSYFSFTPALYNEDGSFAGYDWNATAEPFTLYAHWKEG